MQTIVALWGPSRSVSTAMVKAFARRPGCVALHEPFNDCYYFSRGRVTGMYGEKPELLDYDGMAAERAIVDTDEPLVFFKEMSYLALPYIRDDFLRRCVNTFIVRDPRLALRSRKRHRSGIGEYEYGYTALWVMWLRVTGTFGQPPVVIDGEDLRRQPRRVLEAYCRAIGLPFDEAMLQWPAGPVRDWQEHERDAHARWHRTVESSTGFLPPAEPVDDDAFDFTDEEWRMVRHAMEIYRLMREHALR